MHGDVGDHTESGTGILEAESLRGGMGAPCACAPPMGQATAPGRYPRGPSSRYCALSPPDAQRGARANGEGVAVRARSGDPDMLGF